MSTPRPNVKFLLAHPAHFIALSFGAGLAPRAAGTFGSLMAFPLYWSLAPFLHPLVIAFLAIPGFLLGVWACGVTARNMGVKDPNAICWDETICLLPILALAHSSLALQVFAFFVFRLFDVWKPYPISLIDKHVEGGFGIMLDDAIAALYTYVAVGVVVVGNMRFGWFS
jgi:phosphatidylglycerophosphatase A